MFWGTVDNNMTSMLTKVNTIEVKSDITTPFDQFEYGPKALL